MSLLLRASSGSSPVGIRRDHAHEDCDQLIYTDRGMMSIVTPRERWFLPPGRALWIPRGAVHRLEVRRTANLQLLYFGIGSGASPDWQSCTAFKVSELLHTLIMHCARFKAPPADDSREGRAVRVLLDQVAESPPSKISLPEPNDARLARLARILRDAPADRRPLEVLAPLVGASSRTVQRLFEQETGIGFREWRNRLRLLHALEELASGSNVKAAAYAIGYDNPSSFIAAFRTFFGNTPGQFLEQRQGSPQTIREMGLH